MTAVRGGAHLRARVVDKDQTDRPTLMLAALRRNAHCRTHDGTSSALLAVMLALFLPASSPEVLPDCPGFGTDVEEQLCALWRESVASIPYEVVPFPV